MSQFFAIHPETPQLRLVRQAVEILRGGGVVAYPTDSAYALGCRLGDKHALECIRRIRKLDDNHNFTLVCPDLSVLGTYAKVDNSAYRLIKNATPGPYTFILPGGSDLPSSFKKRKEVGVRIPNNEIVRAILEGLGEPMVARSIKDEDLILEYTTDPELIHEHWRHQVDLVIDGGIGGNTPSTVVDLTVDPPEVIRQGLGSLDLI